MRAKYALFGAVVTSLVLFYGPSLFRQAAQWSAFRPDVAVPNASWRVLYSADPTPCPANAKQAASCPANVDNPSLWQSTDLAVDHAHARRLAKTSARKDYWVGTIVEGDALERVRQTRSTEFFLGLMLGSYRMWVNGVLVATGDFSNDSEELWISLTQARLEKAKALKIAIQIYRDSSHAVPDPFRHHAREAGFSPDRKHLVYRSLTTFWTRTRPFALWLSYSLLGVMLFFFWIPSKSKQEYFYMSIFAFLSAFYHARKAPLANLALHTDLARAVTFVIESYLIAFGMFVGLSFSRTRRALFTWGIPIALALPLVVLALAGVPSHHVMKHIVRLLITPLACMIGGGACLLQAYSLWAERGSEAGRLPERTLRLALFGLTLFSMGIYYYGFFEGWFGTLAYWNGFEHFALLLFLGGVALKDYRDQEMLVARTSVSEYHKRPVLPSAVAGTILVADLKSSEPFYRHRASHEDAENLVSIWRSHFYTAVLRHGGIVINKKGDELTAFFDAEKCASPAVAALKAADEMAQVSRLLESEFRRQQLFPPEAKGFNFRASLTTGAIRPVWEKVGETREAYWEEAGSSTPFVESSRLLELERKIAKGLETTIVMPDAVAAQISLAETALRAKFSARGLAVPDKHGHVYSVSVFSPEALEGSSIAA